MKTKTQYNYCVKKTW